MYRIQEALNSYSELLDIMKMFYGTDAANLGISLAEHFEALQAAWDEVSEMEEDE